MATAFGFGTSQAAPAFGAFGAATSKPAGSSLFGTTNTGFGTATATATKPLFGFGSATTTTTTAAPGFGGFGGFGTAGSTATTSSGLFGGFGQTGTTAQPSALGFGSFGQTAKTTASLFGGFGTATTAAAGTAALGGLGGFGAAQQQQQQQQQLQLQQQQQDAASNLSTAMATALTMPVIFGDERDGVIAKLNQVQALWGFGKGYFSASQAPIDFTMDNPFSRFKTIGYSCLPNAKDEDGLVALELKHKQDYVKTNQQQLVEALHKMLGNAPTLVVCVDGVRSLPDSRTEVIFYVVERAMNGSSRRVTATELYTFLSQPATKTQLQGLGVENMAAKTTLSDSQLQQFLENAPIGVDPILWEQAKKENPMPDKLIPVPMVGNSELVNRLKHQSYQTEQHQKRLNIIAEEIASLQRAHATTVAKLTQYKRKDLELGHRVLQVMIQQETRRKAGYAIEPEEEQLRIQLESIQSEVDSPMQFKGRLIELMSHVRMQSQMSGGRSESRYQIDDSVQEEVKEHLENQQQSIMQLISILKEDMEDLKVIEQGFYDMVNITKK